MVPDFAVAMIGFSAMYRYFLRWWRRDSCFMEEEEGRYKDKDDALKATHPPY